MPLKPYVLLLIAVLAAAGLTILVAFQFGWTSGSLAIPIAVLLILRVWLEVRRRSDTDTK